MLERKPLLIEQLRQDLRTAWNVPTVVIGEPEETEAAPYGVILCGTVEQGEDSTPTLVDEVYPFALIGRFPKPAGVVLDDVKTERVRALTSLLLAGANYATYGFLPSAELIEFDEMDQVDDPEYEVAIRFTVHAYGSRFGTSLD